MNLRKISSSYLRHALGTKDLSFFRWTPYYSPQSESSPVSCTYSEWNTFILHIFVQDNVPLLPKIGTLTNNKLSSKNYIFLFSQRCILDFRNGRSLLNLENLVSERKYLKINVVWIIVFSNILNTIFFCLFTHCVILIVAD